MSSLKMPERQILEQHFGMAGGYVLNFSDRTFGEFVLEAVGRKIHDAKYTAGGTSKANKLRTFWKLRTCDVALSDGLFSGRAWKATSAALERCQRWNVP
jgi:hypothetical protein